MNRIEQILLARPEPRHEVPILRVAALVLLAIVLVAMVVVLFTIQTPIRASILAGAGALAGWPCFLLGRRQARRD